MNVVLQQNATGSIPSKVYDYVQFMGSILALGHVDDAMGRLLDGTRAFVLDPAKAGDIARSLEQAWIAWRSGKRPEPLNADGRFDRSRQFERLLDKMARIAGVIPHPAVGTSH